MPSQRRQLDGKRPEPDAYHHGRQVQDRSSNKRKKGQASKERCHATGKRWNRTRFTEKEEVSKSYYNQPAYMFEIGDREEGGPLLANGVEVHREGEGVQNRSQLD